MNKQLIEYMCTYIIEKKLQIKNVGSVIFFLKKLIVFYFT